MRLPAEFLRNDSRGRPLYDRKTLVVTLRQHEDLASFIQGNSAERASGGLERLMDFVASRGRRAMIKPRFTERAHLSVGDTNKHFVLPNFSSPSSALSAIHDVVLPSIGDAGVMYHELQKDRRVESVRFAAIYYPIESDPVTEDDELDDETAQLWGLRRCKFHRVWDQLDRIDDEHPIAMIDAGRISANPVLEDRVTLVAPDESVPSSKLAHATQVASVIAAKRDVDKEFGMAGCCSAKIDLFDVWVSKTKFDHDAFVNGLKAIASAKYSVVNMSLASEVEEPDVRDTIATAVANDVVVVAGVGNAGNTTNARMFPAAFDDVIGVGATDFNDDRLASSCHGPHVFLSAPGWRILTVQNATRCAKHSGTSLSTAMVSAAVWLAKRNKDGMNTAAVRGLLKKCVDASKVKGDGDRDDEVGHGRLDMLKLAAEVKAPD